MAKKGIKPTFRHQGALIPIAGDRQAKKEQTSLVKRPLVLITARFWDKQLPRTSSPLLTTATTLMTEKSLRVRDISPPKRTWPPSGISG